MTGDVPSAQIPGVYHRRIGDIVVTAISDGYLDARLRVHAQHRRRRMPSAS